MPNPTQSASKATSRAAQSGAKTPSKQGPGQSSGAQSAMKRDLKSKDFAAGEEALKPKDDKLPQVATLTAQQQKKIAADLGKAHSIQAANAVLGSFLQALAPSPGTSVEVDLDLKIFVDGIMVGLDLGGRVEHTKHGVELSGNLGLAIGVGAVAGAGITENAVWAAVKGTMGFKAKGDSGGECLDLIMLGVDRWLRNREVTFLDAVTSPGLSAMKATGNGAWIADAIFGGGFSAKVMKAMDPKSRGDEADTLESSFDLGLDFGAEGKAGVGKLAASAGASGNMRRETVSTLAKNDKGQLKSTSSGGIAGDFGLNFGIGPFAVEGSGSFFKPDSGAVEAEFSVALDLPKGAGAVADFAKKAFEAWELASGKAAAKVGGKAGVVLKKAATDGPRSSALAALEGLGLVSPSVRVTFGMEGKERTFAIEVTRSASFDEKVGAGAGGTVAASVEMGTKILDKSWAVS